MMCRYELGGNNSFFFNTALNAATDVVKGDSACSFRG